MGPVERFFRKYQSNVVHLLFEEYSGFLTRSLPGLEGILTRRLIYRRLFKALGKSSLIYAGVYLTHTYGIEAGNNLSINTGALLDGRGGIQLGNGVMIGPYAVLVSSSHQFEDITIPMTSLDHIMQPLVIEDDVWIGAHAFIKGGIRIGRGSIIAAGAVVNKDVADYTVVAGVPAVVVSDRIKDTNE